MKRVTKDSSPEWFEKWKDEFRRSEHREPHYVYDFSTGDEAGGYRRTRLRRQLVKEQGGICCYCMSKITADKTSSHIEHFWPKSVFEDKDLEYSNLFASCEGNYSGEDFCGHKKDDWWDVGMIPPTDARVEKIFEYSEDGEIHSIKGNADSDIAHKMIINMGLDSFHLKRNRRDAIAASEVFDEQDYSEEEIRSFIEYYDNMIDGEYVPYCKAIIDCLRRML